MADAETEPDEIGAIEALVDELERTPLPASIGPFNDHATRAVFASGYLYATEQLRALARSGTPTHRNSSSTLP